MILLLGLCLKVDTCTRDTNTEIKTWNPPLVPHHGIHSNASNSAVVPLSPPGWYDCMSRQTMSLTTLFLPPNNMFVCRLTQVSTPRCHNPLCVCGAHIPPDIIWRVYYHPAAISNYRLRAHPDVIPGESPTVSILHGV